MRLTLATFVVLVAGCSLEESEPLDDADDPDAQPVDPLAPEVNCPDLEELIACLPFDGNTADQRNSHDVDVIDGETTFVDGAVNNALEVGSSVLAPFDRAGDFESASATLELWLGPDPTPGFIFDYDQRISVRLFEDRVVRCIARTPEGERSTSTAIDTSRWNHLACVFGMRGIEMYIDRTMVDHNPTVTAMTPSPSRTAHLGSDSPSGDEPFSGQIDNLRFWQREISAEELCLECDLIDDPNL